MRRTSSRYAGPADPELRREWRSRRRAAARQHHPDRGGAPGSLHEALERVDLDVQAREHPALIPALIVGTPAPWWQPASRRLGRTRKRARRGVRAVRSHIPRSWPGSRRYLDL